MKEQRRGRRKGKRSIALLVCALLCAAVLGRSMPAYAYTEEEKQQAKSWLSSHGYAPTRAGAEQAYQDYLDGKFSTGGEEDTSDEDAEEMIIIGGEEEDEEEDTALGSGELQEEEEEELPNTSSQIYKWEPDTALREEALASFTPEQNTQSRGPQEEPKTGQDGNTSEVPQNTKAAQQDASEDTPETDAKEPAVKEVNSSKLPLLIVGLIAILAVVFGWDFWHQRKKERNEDE